MMRQRRLWPLVVMPALVNLGLFVLALALVLSQGDVLTGWIWAKPSGLLVPAWYALYALVLAAGLVFSYLFVLIVGGVVASPFNDKLSERTEEVLLEAVPASVEGSVLTMLRSVASSGLITLLYGVLLLPVLLLYLVPGPGSLLAMLLGQLLAAFFMALEYTDVTFQRHGHSLRRKVRYLRKNPVLAGSFGIGASLMLWIPVVNFLCIPVAVVAGTALALHLEAQR